MLRFEELPEVNSERWMSLEDLPDEGWRDIEGYIGVYMVSNYGSRSNKNKKLLEDVQKTVEDNVKP